MVNCCFYPIFLSKIKCIFYLKNYLNTLWYLKQLQLILQSDLKIKFDTNLTFNVFVAWLKILKK